MATNNRKNVTRRELELALLRIQKKRPRKLTVEQCRLSITSVATEAGLTPAAIHNCYPDIAERIRTLMGKSSRLQRDQKNDDLQQAKKLARQYRQEVIALKADIAKLVSINASLILNSKFQEERISELDAIMISRNVAFMKAPA
jgi:hypothetical protein